MLIVNGLARQISSDPDRTLLDVLRTDLDLKATRFGCGEGLCGACTVIVDGRAVTTCNTPLWSVEGKSITTLEGLGSEIKPHPLQQAFIDAQAMQCGYCVSGIIMSAAALLMAKPEASDYDIRTALENNLCRCGAHNRMLRAITKAAADLRGEAARG
ncbi:MAG: (2Fe-2S)-binding protein [Beijerinckiaceae bacterium]